MVLSCVSRVLPPAPSFFSSPSSAQVPSKATIMGYLGRERATTTPAALPGYEKTGARTVSCGTEFTALGELVGETVLYCRRCGVGMRRGEGGVAGGAVIHWLCMACLGFKKRLALSTPLANTGRREMLYGLTPDPALDTRTSRAYSLARVSRGFTRAGSRDGAYSSIYVVP